MKKTCHQSLVVNDAERARKAVIVKDLASDAKTRESASRDVSVKMKEMAEKADTVA